MEKDTVSKLIVPEEEDSSKEAYFASVKAYIYRNIGVIGGIFCGTLNASMEIAGKSMIGYYPPAELTFLRYSIHFPLNIAIILAAKGTFKPCVSEIKYLLPLGMFGSFAYLLLYRSFVNLPYFDSFSVVYGILVISSIMIGRIWLKENISRYVVIMCVVVLIGIVMIAHPTFHRNENDMIGYLCSIGSGISMGVMCCIARKIKETPSTTSVFYICLCILPVSTIAMIIENEVKFPRDCSEILMPLFIGCASMTMHSVWNKCLKLSDVSKVTLAVQCEIPVGFLLQWIFMEEIPNTSAIIGSCCIVIGVILTALEDIIMLSLRRQNP